MFGRKNVFRLDKNMPYPFGRRSACAPLSFADRIADEILYEAGKLNAEQAKRFNDWLEGHFNENNFDFADSSRQERLRIWLNLQTPMLLLREYEILLKQLEYFGRDNEASN